MDPILSDPMPELRPPSSGMDPTRSAPMSELVHPLPECTRPYPTRHRSPYIILRCGNDPIRSDTGVCTVSSGMDPIISDQIPKLTHPLPEWIRSYPVRYQSLCPCFRNGSDPIRSHTEAHTYSSGMDPTLSDPIPELIHYLQVWNRSYPIRYRMLHTIFRKGSDPIRSDTEAYTSSSGMGPILADLIPRLMPLLPEWIRPDPIPCRGLHVLFRIGPDPIRPDTGAYTLSSGVEPILSDPMPELVHPLPEWIRSHPIRHRSLCALSRNGPGSIRSDTGAYTSSPGMDPTLSDPIPELIHPRPEWARPYPTRYRSVYLIFKCGADPIRSDTGVCALSSGMEPNLSDPIPMLVHHLPEWIRSDPIRHQSLYFFLRNGSDPIPERNGVHRSQAIQGPTLIVGNAARIGSG